MAQLLYWIYNREMSRAKLPKISTLKKKLWKEVARFIKERDGEYCFDCGLHCTGQQLQAGHWIPNSTSGARLRYHPHNIHSQAGKCNLRYQQEDVKVRYSLTMAKVYGEKRVNELYQLKNKYMKDDRFYVMRLIELYSNPYSESLEMEIIDFLEK